MKSNFKSAYAELAALGVPVFQRPDHIGRGIFGISAEETTSQDWLDYYCAPPSWDFGVSPVLSEVLSKHGLFAEWETPGSVNVYSI